MCFTAIEVKHAVPVEALKVRGWSTKNSFIKLSANQTHGGYYMHLYAILSTIFCWTNSYFSTLGWICKKIGPSETPQFDCNLKIFCCCRVHQFDSTVLFLPQLVFRCRALRKECWSQSFLNAPNWSATSLSNLQGQEKHKNARRIKRKSKRKWPPDITRESKLIKNSANSSKMNSPTKFNCQDIENLDDLKVRAVTISMADSDFEITAQTRHGAVSNHTGSRLQGVVCPQFLQYLETSCWRWLGQPD